MKTVMKKLLSVMLVALLLVSAVPMAFAADGYSYQITIEGYTFDAVDPDGTVTAADLYEFLEMSQGEDAGLDAWIASVAPVDVKSGMVVLNVAVGSGSNDNTGSGSNNNTGSGSNGNTGSGSTTTPGNGGEAQPIPGVTKCTLSIDYQLSGYPVSTVNASVGKLYKEYVGVPARNGYDFAGWYSSNYGRIVDIEKDILMGDDTITGIWSEAKKYSLTLDENRGEEETINTIKRVTYGQAIGTLPTPVRKGYVFVGWKLNGKIINAETVWSIPGDGTAYATWKLESDTEGEIMGGTNTADGKVYLEIYTNGKTDKYVKKVDITNYADDNKITRAEVETVAKKYVTAKAGYSLAYEGLFDEETWWWYVRDPETNGAASVVVNKDGDDYIYVMVNNVKNVSDKPADKTNPQTGDAIGIALALMLSSGGAVLTLGKKKFF